MTLDGAEDLLGLKRGSQRLRTPPRFSYVCSLKKVCACSQVLSGDAPHTMVIKMKFKFRILSAMILTVLISMSFASARSSPGFSIDYISSTIVQYDDTLTVMGNGVTAGNTVELYWDDVTAANPLNTTTGLLGGTFECEVDVPSAYYGNHYLWAKYLATGICARSDAIFVVPKLKLSPSSGLEGDNVIVKGYGFSDDSDIVITFGGLAEGIGEDETDELGYFEYTFKVGDVVDGDYIVTAVDADFHNAITTFTLDVLASVDLILEGNEIFIIEDCVYNHVGNIIVRDNASLILRNATLALYWPSFHKYDISFEDSSYFESFNSTITDTPSSFNGGGYYLFMKDSSFANITASRFHYPATLLCASGSEVTVKILDSHLDYINIGSYSNVEINNSQATISIYFGSPNVTIWDSENIGQIRIRFSGTAYADLSLQPGYHSYWSLQENETISNCDIEVTIFNSTVLGWSLRSYSQNDINVKDSTLNSVASHADASFNLENVTVTSRISSEDNSSITLRDSTINRMNAHDYSKIQMVNTSVDVHGEVNVFNESEIYVGWYLDVTAINEEGPIEGAIVEVYTRPEASLVDGKLTDEEGIARFDLWEKIIRANGTDFINTYDMVCEYQGARLSEEILLTGNYELLINFASAPLINPVPGQYANYTLYLHNETVDRAYGWCKVTYQSYVTPILVNVSAEEQINDMYGEWWWLVNVMNRIMFEGTNVTWSFWIETDIKLDDEIVLESFLAKVVDSGITDAAGFTREYWILESDHPSENITYLWGFDKETGILIYLKSLFPEGETNFTLTSTNIFTSICTREIPLFEGWNLIGLPCIPEDPSIEVVLADILDNVESVWAFNGETKTWSSYAPGAPSDLTEMVDGKGYWIKVNTDAILTIYGDS
ncbi:hypothetical protein ES703_20204 [subsurface metagenome]